MTVRYIRFDSPGWRNPGRTLPSAIRAEIESKFAPPNGCMLLAYDAATPEKIIGTAGFTKVHAGICEASRVVVGWPYQKKGIGRGLVMALMKEAQQAGYHTMWIRVPTHISALVAFFTRMGFRELALEEGETSHSILFEAALTEV